MKQERLIASIVYSTIVFTFFLFMPLHAMSQRSDYNVQHYTSENGLPQSSVKVITMDAKGYLWLATEGGLVRFDGTQFKLYNQLSDGRVLTKRISDLYTTDMDYSFIRAEDDAFYKTTKQNTLDKYLPSIKELALVEKLSNGFLYNLYEVTRNRVDEKISPSWIIPDRRLLTAKAENSLFVLGDRCYYFNENRELISADTAISDFRKIKMSGFVSKVNSQNLPTVSFLQQGDTIFLRWDDYIYQTSFSTDRTQLNGDSILRVGNLPKVTAFLNYRLMNLFFVGTLTDGLYVFEKLNFSTRIFKNPESNILYAQAPYGKDGVLTEKGILPEDKKKLLNGYLYVSILEKNDGQYLLNRWLGNKNAGLSILDTNLNEIKFIPEPGLRTRSMRQLKDGTIVISSRNQFIGKLQNDSITWIKRPAQLDSFFVDDMIESHDGELWIAGQSGLARFNIHSGKCEVFPELSNIPIRSLHLDKNGALWIGSYGNGFFCYYNGKVTQMPLDRNGYLLHTHSFLEDKNGNCWMTTNHGLFVAKISDLYDYLNKKVLSIYYHYYDRTSGFLTNEFNGGCSPSGIILNNGFFSFPSLNGIVQFDPLAVQPVFCTNPIQIDAIRKDSVAIDPSIDNFVVSNRTMRLQFQVSSPFFGNPYNQIVYYKLSAHDSDWRKLAPEGTIVFDNLSKGNYELILQKASGFHNRKIEKRMRFVVKPLFYETWGFKLFVLVFLLSLFYGIYRLRVLMLVQQRNLLQAEVGIRTKEQNTLIENLETTISELEKSRGQLYRNNVFFEKLAMIITHDLQSPIRFFSEASIRISQEAIAKKLSTIEELSAEQLKTSAAMNVFLNNIGLWIKTLGKNFAICPANFLLSDLLEELSQFFSEQIKLYENKIIIDVNCSIYINTDRQLLTVVLRNLIDNANKFTRSGTISIKASVTDTIVQIFIADTGSGIERSILYRLQRLAKEDNSNFTKEDLPGHGYQFIIDFCKLLNISIQIESVSNVGTKVALIFIPNS